MAGRSGSMDGWAGAALWTRYGGLAAVTAAAATQATLGFGFGAVALPFLVALYGAKQAVALNIVLSGVSGVAWAVRLRRQASPVLTPWLVAGGLAGLVAGVAGYRFLDPRSLALVALTMALGALALHGRTIALPRPPAAGWAYAGGCAAGFFHAAVGVGSPPLVLVLGSSGLAKEAHRATATVFFAAAFPVALAGHAAAGTYHGPVVMEALRLLPAVPVGMLLGHAVFRRLPMEWYLRLVLAMLLAGSVAAVARHV